MLTLTKVEVRVCLIVVTMTVVDDPVPIVYVRTLSLVKIETFVEAPVAPVPSSTLLLGFSLALNDPLLVGNGALGPVLTETKLDGRRLADMLVPELSEMGLTVGPVPIGAELLEIGSGEIDGVDCGATKVLLFGTDPYP